MSDHIKRTIAELQGKLREQDEAAALTRRMINDLCRLAGMQPLYADTASESKTNVTSIRGDQFYGRALASVVREYLELRRTSNLGPAAVTEIYDALIRGGYKFETKNDVNAMRGLRQSLTKNSTTFHKLPGGEYGLLEWYPNAKHDDTNGSSGKKAKKKPRSKAAALATKKPQKEVRRRASATNAETPVEGAA